MHLFGLQRLHGGGDCQVGLAGPGRADPEGDRARLDGVDVAPLAGGHRSHRAATDAAHDLVREHLRGAYVCLHHLDRPSDVGGVEPLAALELGDELVEDPADLVGIGAVDRDLVAAHPDRRVVELPLDEEEELVPLTEQPDHQVVAGNVDLQLGRGHGYRCEGTSGPSPAVASAAIRRRRRRRRSRIASQTRTTRPAMPMANSTG